MGLLSLLGCSKPTQSDGSSPAPSQAGLKTVSYRGGIVNFRIPVQWREEYATDGGGTFYDGAPNSATLRVNVITVQAPSTLTPASAPELLSGLRQASNGVERLPTGSAFIRFSETAEESGHLLRITYWTVASTIPPNHGRIANFSYTILASQQSDPHFQHELELFDREIRTAVFSPELGVTPR